MDTRRAFVLALSQLCSPDAELSPAVRRAICKAIHLYATVLWELGYVLASSSEVAGDSPDTVSEDCDYLLRLVGPGPLSASAGVSVGRLGSLNVVRIGLHYFPGDPVSSLLARRTPPPTFWGDNLNLNVKPLISVLVLILFLLIMILL